MTVRYPREQYYAEVIALREQVDYLKAELSELRKILLSPQYLPNEWRLTAGEARMVIALAQRRQGLKREALHVSFSNGLDTETDIKVIDVMICKIRSKLKHFGIEVETIWGQGYRLTEKSIAIVEAAASGVEP